MLSSCFSCIKATNIFRHERIQGVLFPWTPLEKTTREQISDHQEVTRETIAKGGPGASTEYIEI